jgi:hypothetical protein
VGFLGFGSVGNAVLNVANNLEFLPSLGSGIAPIHAPFLAIAHRPMLLRGIAPYSQPLRLK